MTREKAIAHGKEQLEIFGGEHKEFIKLALEALKQEPCVDAISREAVKDAVESTIAKYIPTFIGSQQKIPLELASAIKKVSGVTTINKWIPVSKGLPEEYGNYLVSTNEGEVDIGTYDNEKGWSMCDANGFYLPQYKGIEIVAWMPLPEEYKESEQHG